MIVTFGRAEAGLAIMLVDLIWKQARKLFGHQVRLPHARESLCGLITVRNSTCKICADPGKQFWKKFPWKMQNPWKSLEFTGNANKKMLDECNVHDYLR